MLIEAVLLEGFKDDQRYLIEKHPDHAQELSRLQPKWISWLAARFGERPNVEETHPFEDAIVTVLNFSKRDASLSAKYAAPGTEEKPNVFKASVDEAFPPEDRSWKSPTDATTMTVDEMELILGLSERKKERFKTEVSEDEMESDRVGKIGPWNLWMPTTKERSCRIAGYDPVTRKPKTVWCTARMAGSNLFYNYIGAPGREMTLFYIIRDDPKQDQDWLSLGFVNGKPELGGQFGGVSVDRSNAGLTPESLKAALGQHHDAIMRSLTEKNKSLGGIHPAHQKIKDAAGSVVALKYLTQGLSAEESKDLKIRVLKDPDIKPEVLQQLAYDEEGDIRWHVAGNRATPVETLQILALDKDLNIRRSVAGNQSAPADTLVSLSQDSSDLVRQVVARNASTPIGVVQTLSRDPNEKTRASVAAFKSTPTEIIQTLANDNNAFVRGGVAANQAAPDKLLRILANDDDALVRVEIARNPSTPPDILSSFAQDMGFQIRNITATNTSTPVKALALLADDESELIRANVAFNASAPPEVLMKLARDKSQSVRTRVHVNPNVPIEALQVLTRDRSTTIRKLAGDALTKRQQQGLNERQLRQLIRQIL